MDEFRGKISMLQQNPHFLKNLELANVNLSLIIHKELETQLGMLTMLQKVSINFNNLEVAIKEYLR